MQIMERPLDWGIQGPQGIQGIQGEPGEGTSVYYASGVAQNAVSITGGPYQPNAWGIEVLKLELPAGKFLVNGDISVVGSLSLQPAQAVLVSCNILGGTYTVGDSTDESLYGVGQVAIGQRYGSSSTSTMSLTAAGVLTGPGLVSIRCMAALLGEPTPSNRELAIANLPTLSATRVSALEVQGV